MRVSVHNIYPTTHTRLTTSKAREIPQLTEADRFRFAAKVRRGGERDCWLWTAARVPGGHGQMGLGQRPHVRPFYAHRIAWTIANGPVPEGQSVLHHCDNPICVNPAHLFLGDQDANMKDAARKGRLAIERKRNRGKKAEAIARYLAGGVTQSDLAAAYGVHKLTICRWLKGQHEPYARLSRRTA